MAGGLAGWLGYTETELDPSVQSEILIETSRTEARLAILMILIAFGFGAWYGFVTDRFRAVALFCLVIVVPLLTDSAIRRRASQLVEGIGPRPPPGLR